MRLFYPQLLSTCVHIYPHATHSHRFYPRATVDTRGYSIAAVDKNPCIHGISVDKTAAVDEVWICADNNYEKRG